MQESSGHILSYFLDSIERRLTNLEIIVGESDNDVAIGMNFSSQVDELQQILLEVYQRGFKYTSNILVLLDSFLLDEDVPSSKEDEELNNRKNIVLSCQEEINTLAERIEALRLMYEKSVLYSKGHNNWSKRKLVSELSGLQQLPELMRECEQLVFNSISVCQKFVDYTILCNEFLITTKERLK